MGGECPISAQTSAIVSARPCGVGRGNDSTKPLCATRRHPATALSGPEVPSSNLGAPTETNPVCGRVYTSLDRGEALGARASHECHGLRAASSEKAPPPSSAPRIAGRWSPTRIQRSRGPTPRW